MDTLLLTRHFLFEQKQLSLQTPCSGCLWLLLKGSDLFTQPRDKVGFPTHPGATPIPSTPHVPPLQPPLQLPKTWWCCWWRLEPLSTLHPRCVWSPCAQGFGPGLIRSSMTKWAERPQPQPAPASNHSSLNWQGSSHGPTGVKSWITFSFLSLSNYPHPPTCSPSQSDYVWLASSLSYFTMPHNPSAATPTLPHLLPSVCLDRCSLYYCCSQTTLYFTASLTRGIKV